jgi:TusA-related sulfurtransferase
MPLDLRGLNCLLPFLRTRKMLCPLARGNCLIVERTDPLAGMNSMRRFMRGKESVGRTKTMPGGQDNQHAKARAKIMRNHIEDRRVAAMRVQKNELAAAGAMHAFAKFCPGPDEGFGRKTERAGKIRVLDRKPAISHGQKQNGEFVRHARHDVRDKAFHDECIGAQRQMRAMLLGRGDR